MYQPTIAVVTTQTRLKGLVARWGSRSSAKFRIAQTHAVQNLEHSQSSLALTQQAQELADFDEYEAEDLSYDEAVKRVRTDIDFGFPSVIVPRAYLPNFDFRNCCAVVVVGPDGLVANTAKYVGDLPILGVNPDKRRFDGLLLPIELNQVRSVLQRTIKESARVREVTMGEVNLNDGQRLLAFNDFFIGCRTHTSARYTLQVDRTCEPQSSSGVIVATGAGSTGWLSSVFNMVRGVARFTGDQTSTVKPMRWEDRSLAWVVREPFASLYSKTNLVAGMLEEGQVLRLESLMPERGVIFSDGVESDGIDFNSGSIASISVAKQRAKLVIG